MIVSLVIFVLVYFRRLKLTMWNTNLLLKIIPYKMLSQDDAMMLKKFFVN